MPRKILHCLFSVEEEREMRVNGFGLDTHGVQHVVIQFERGKRKAQTEPVAAIEEKPKVRKRTAMCRYCKQLCAPQGKWKHEEFCVKKPKGAK